VRCLPPPISVGLWLARRLLVCSGRRARQNLPHRSRETTCSQTDGFTQRVKDNVSLTVPGGMNGCRKSDHRTPFLIRRVPLSLKAGYGSGLQPDGIFLPHEANGLTGPKICELSSPVGCPAPSPPTAPSGRDASVSKHPKTSGQLESRADCRRGRRLRRPQSALRTGSDW
jgi:hypothetical protein